MAKTNDSVNDELSAMRRCANILTELPAPAQHRVVQWLATQNIEQNLGVDPRQNDLFAKDAE